MISDNSRSNRATASDQTPTLASFRKEVKDNTLIDSSIEELNSEALDQVVTQELKVKGKNKLPHQRLKRRKQ